MVIESPGHTSKSFPLPLTSCPVLLFFQKTSGVAHTFDTTPELTDGVTLGVGEAPGAGLAVGVIDIDGVTVGVIDAVGVGVGEAGGLTHPGLLLNTAYT
tara:strand:+ start:5887 stop:6183 length:297 start_codon:yes stop_codon:yes gene_type:complete